jgi:hypothetical protein
MINNKSFTLAPVIRVKNLLWINSLLPGLILLCIGLALGYLFRYVGYFMQDEGGNIAIGYLIGKGQVLYRDLFTHHFPFPYYWIAAMLSLRRSLQVVRLSVLLFQLGVFTTIMALTRAYIAVGLTAVLWNVIAPYYFGNQAIYPTFAGLSLLVIFAVTLVVLSDKRGLTRAETLAWGVFAAIALLSNPLSVLPVGVSGLALLINAPSRTRILWGGLLAVGICSSSLAYFWSAGAVPAMYSQVLDFNLHVYNRYLVQQDFSLAQAARMAFKASIFGHNQWNQALHLMPLGAYPPVISALAGGTLYRITAAVILLGLLLKRRWLVAGFFYAFLAAVIFRSEEFYRQVPFILVSLLSIVWLILGQFHASWSPFRLREEKEAPGGAGSFFPGLQLAASLFAGTLLVFLMVQFLVHRFSHPDDLGFFANFHNYYPQASDIKEITCGQDFELGVYPGDPLIYFYTDLEPVAGYTYFFPWVAEKGLPAVLSAVQTEKTIIWIDQEAVVWGMPVKKYLAELVAYLDLNYVRIKDYYVAPGILRSCYP